MYSISSILTYLSIVFVTPSVTADYRVYETKIKSEAHLFVWESKTKTESLNEESRWFFASTKTNSNFTIRWVKSKWQSDIIIYKTSSKFEAGWKKYHPLKNKLHIR